MAEHRHIPHARTFAAVLVTLAVVMVVASIAARFAPWELTLGNLVVRSQRGMNHPFRPPAKGVKPVSAPVRRDPPVSADLTPRNAVLVIGDGMGIGQLSAASMLLHGPYGELTLEDAPFAGLMKTHAGDHLVTDSAASATAMATGFKAPKKSISKLAGGREPVTLFEAARNAGFVTGVVTTSGLVDATPACFIAHAEKREHYSDILDDMLASDAELLIGGDWSDYTKALRDADFQSRLGRIDQLGAAAGYRVVHDPADLGAEPGRVLALFQPRDRGGDAHGPPLEELARFGLERLAARESGFILLVESELTDGTGHSNDVAALSAGIRELDDAVSAILGWAEPRGDTLVLVTADHDTGGLAVVDGDHERGVAEVRWATSGHTTQWVPVFAFGPGADRFTGVIDNTDLGVLIAAALGIDGFPTPRP